MQDRMGPNRVGPQGLLQTIADALKLMTKEDITPIGADRLVYNIAPILSVVAVISMWAVIPFAATILGTAAQRGRAVHRRCRLAGHAGHHDGRLVVQQQICPAGRLPHRGAVGVLRSAA